MSMNLAAHFLFEYFFYLSSMSHMEQKSCAYYYISETEKGNQSYRKYASQLKLIRTMS